ncbi:MAG TPA: CBS domain-containing protein [Phycisphaerae bacterium]|nr:CBS domain-containing protein [Phycisphaerae bacterium]
MSLVRDVLGNKGGQVWKVEKDSSALDAAKIMHEKHIGSVVVVSGEKIVGIFTERDLMNRIVAEERDPANTPVGTVMTERVAICTRDTSLETCRGVMTRNRLRHLPVVEEGRLVGIISAGDIFARELKDQQDTIQYLHDYMVGPN